jgi:hypothetical protein
VTKAYPSRNGRHFTPAEAQGTRSAKYIYSGRLERIHVQRAGPTGTTWACARHGPIGVGPARRVVPCLCWAKYWASGRVNGPLHGSQATWQLACDVLLKSLYIQADQLLNNLSTCPKRKKKKKKRVMLGIACSFARTVPMVATTQPKDRSSTRPRPRPL